MRGSGFVADPGDGVRAAVDRLQALFEKLVLPHLKEHYELWPWLLMATGLCTVLSVLFLIGIYTSPNEPPRWMISRGSKDVKVEDHTVVAADGVRLRGVSKGSGPPIVLLHGAGGSSDIFSFLFKRFSLRGFRAVAFDLRGHGDSDAVVDLPPAKLAADLHAILEHLDLRDATLVGYDLGGYAALALAKHYPSTVATRVGRFVLLSSYAQTPSEMRSWLGKMYTNAFTFGLMHLVLRWRRLGRFVMRPFFGRNLTCTLEEEWRRAVLHCPRNVWAQGLNAGLPLSQPPSPVCPPSNPPAPPPLTTLQFSVPP